MAGGAAWVSQAFWDVIAKRHSRRGGEKGKGKHEVSSPPPFSPLAEMEHGTKVKTKEFVMEVLGTVYSQEKKKGAGGI